MAASSGSSAPSADIPSEWKAEVLGIPGYDPTRGAEGCWFDADAAARACDFFAQCLRHIEGGVAGQPFVLAPWQRAVVANLFGWKRKDALGRVVRRYRELFLYVPRKNGKTPLCAGIGLYVFFCDGEPGQQGYIAAKDKEQAGLLFRQMQGMVQAEPMLRGRCRVYGGNAVAGQSRSFVKNDASFLKIISGDGEGKHGGNPHVVIVDELHEQKDRTLVDALQTSMVSANRKQSLMICLTTADYDRPSICNEKYREAKRVQAEPERDPAFLPVVYEAEPTADPFSPETWKKANPNLGVSVGVDEFARLARKAQDEPAFDPEFRRLHLNVRTRSLVERAIDMLKWDACGEPFEVEDLAGRPCWAGLDFGWRDDFAALVFVFPGEGATDPVYVLPKFWVPEAGRRDLRSDPTARFIAGGHLVVTDGNSTDMELIYDALREARDQFDLQTVAIDPANAGKQAQDLMADGFDVVEFYQSKRNYSEPWKWMAADGLANRRLRHGGHPVLQWMASNTAAEIDGLEGVMPKKRKSPEKIDGICAMCMGIGAWLTDPDRAGGPSVYESRGLVSVYGEDTIGPDATGQEEEPEAPVGKPDETGGERSWAFRDPYDPDDD